MHLGNYRKHGLCSANKIKAFKEEMVAGQMCTCYMLRGGWPGKAGGVLSLWFCRISLSKMMLILSYTVKY